MNTCLGCGEEFESSKAHAKFCCTKCRKCFNNLRATRGAVLYDAFMATRYDRKAATEAGVDRTFLTRLAAMWNQMDKGQRSYRTPEELVHEYGCQVNATTWRMK